MDAITPSRRRRVKGRCANCGVEAATFVDHRGFCVRGAGGRCPSCQGSVYPLLRGRKHPPAHACGRTYVGGAWDPETSLYWAAAMLVLDERNTFVLFETRPYRCPGDYPRKDDPVRRKAELTAGKWLRRRNALLAAAGALS